MIDAQSRLAPYLLPGERFVWADRPPQGFRLTPFDIFLIPFSLMWGGFAIFWEIMAVTQGAGLFFTLWGIPFVLIGLYLIVGRFFQDAMTRKRQMYAVTDRRVLLLKSWPRATVRSLDIDRLPALELSERGNGRGSITFEQSRGPWSNAGLGFWIPSLDPTLRFLDIPNVRHVYSLIQRQAELS